VSNCVTGTLYVVATPIGNREDLSPRAVRVLKEANIIAAEDTRHSKNLMVHFNIDTRLLSYHEFNETERAAYLIEQLNAGKNVALISDAGTPLINDPGYRLVRAAHQQGIRVVPVPGPSALICALSAAGLPSARFVFEGYPPDRRAARINYLRQVKPEARTVIFYEASHRIQELLADMREVFGPARRITVAREMTKKFETIQTGPVGELVERMLADKNSRKGEFVVLVEGEEKQAGQVDQEAENMLKLLLEELPPGKAASLVSRFTGISKNILYRAGLNLQEARQRKQRRPRR